LSVRQEINPAHVLTILFRVILTEEFNSNLVALPGDIIEFEFLVCNPGGNSTTKDGKSAESRFASLGFDAVASNRIAQCAAIHLL